MKVEDILQSFYPECVSDKNGLQTALLHLRRITSEAKRRPDSMEQLIDAVSNAPLPSLAPFVLFHRECFYILGGNILKSNMLLIVRSYIGKPDDLVKLFFPTDSNAFPNSAAYRLLHALRGFFLAAVPSYDKPRELSPMHLKVSNALVALRELSKLRQSPAVTSPFGSAEAPIHDDENGDDEEELGFCFKVKRTKRRSLGSGASRKGHRRTATQPVQIDEKMLRSLGISVPTTDAGTEILVKKILNEQKGILIEYIQLLQKDAMEPYVTANHLRSQNAQENPMQPSNDEIACGSLDHTGGEPNNAPSSVFPMIRPMRAAQYFEGQGAELGDWPIYISTRAFRHLRQLNGGDAAVLDIVKKKIKELSHGHFSDSNQKVLVGNGNGEVPIFEAKMSRDLRLVYQVDCGSHVDKCEDGSEYKYEKQQLRLHGIFTHAQLDKRLWASVAAQSQKRGSEYRRRCVWREVAKNRNKGVNVTPPAVFPPRQEGEEQGSDVATQSTLEDVDYLKLHDILALEKFIPYSHTLLDTIRDDEDVAHVFDVSTKEDEIIYHGSSCLVVGRSGTGKTTTMLFKMVALERAAEHSGTKIRQIFVTQSRVLAGRVEEYFKKLALSSHPTTAKAGVPEGDADIVAKPQQELLDFDDEVDHDERLPSRWSDLQDNHFPLFLTFHQLCHLLEGDCDPTHRGPRTYDQYRIHGRHTLTDAEVNMDSLEVEDVALPMEPAALKSLKGGLLTFERFQTTIWPHFDATLVKGLDPASVFSEFMGVIRGCEESLVTPSGYIDRYAYENMSARVQSTFARSRPKIYSLFEAYMKQKRILGCYDIPERTHALLKSGVANNLVDFLYVDEAQDNLLIDAGLLRSLCKSPHGMFFAGDTAQTIAIGSSFRFDDLKAYLYRIENADLMVKERKRQAVHPAFFQLSVNYRSHRGIVNTATSVVGLITKLFPHSIDTLTPERGIVDGPKPVFFAGWGEDVRYEQFLFGESTGPIEFGAEQVILVRNKTARDALRAKINSEVGLILTLYESKGLEFSDVLLYDFFADSPASAADWRVVLTALAESERCGIAVPRFDETRHAAIQSELKFLYVGLTRARKHIWLWDSSSTGDAMKVFWKSKGLIEICKKGDAMPILAVQSTRADWAKSGRLLFAKKLYSQSIFCFGKAEQPLEKAIAEAYLSRQQARKLLSRDPKRSAAFVTTGSAFEYAAALSTEMQAQMKKLFLAAAECFIQGGRHAKAAKAYYNAEEFTEAALEYRKAKYYDQAVEVIHVHRALINPKTAEEVILVAKLAYVKANQLTKAERLFRQLATF
ncbi:hypothetical protein FRB93_010040 [Tulasnella sp. JGI-2019a]|nr:hypothetical protein FRB93_010040 [Tulasnella sp. JGI-2019a]